jgi:hypothetical protein
MLNFFVPHGKRNQSNDPLMVYTQSGVFRQAELREIMANIENRLYLFGNVVAFRIHVVQQTPELL